MYYGYARVSTLNQNLDRQIDDIIKLGVNPKFIYTDKESGKDFNRTNYKKLVKKLKPGDILYIKSIDRLGRNYSMVLDEWRMLTKEKGVEIVVIDMPLLNTKGEEDTLIRKVISDVVLELLSFVAENERATLKQRQKEGIRMAKLRGVKFGRPKVTIPHNFNEIVNKYKNNEINIDEAINLSGLSRGTFYRRMNEMNKAL